MKKYKRILLKLSGEALSGDKGFGVDQDMLKSTAKVIKSIYDLGIEIGVVIGGGNFFRGRSSENMARSDADYIGMLATCMNSMHLKSALINLGIPTKVQSSINMEPVCEFFNREETISYLEQGKVVIFAGGTGNPFFSTDTAASLRAAEISADAILSAKNIDGVYDSDPNENPNAKKYNKLTYSEILEKQLNVIDMSAASLCMNNQIPTIIFSLKDPDNIKQVINGKNIGTYIS